MSRDPAPEDAGALRALADLTADPVVLLDAALRPVHVNAAAAERLAGHLGPSGPSGPLAGAARAALARGDEVTVDLVAEGVVGPRHRARVRAVPGGVIVVAREVPVAPRPPVGDEAATLLDAMGEGVLLVDGDGRVMRANPAASDVLGVPPGSLPGMTLPPTGWVPVGEDGTPTPGEQCPVPVTARTGRPLRRRLMRAREADGAERFAEVSTAALRRPGAGPPFPVVMTVAEVTGRVAAGRALQASEERYRLLAEHSSDMIVRHGIDGVVRYISPSVERILGWTPEEVLRGGMPDLVHPGDMALIRSAQARSAWGTVVVTVRMRHRDGTWRAIELSASLVQAQRGGPPEVVAVGRDVTPRAEAEAALRASEERYRSLVASMAEGLLLYSPDGVIEEANPAAARILGIDQADLPGRPAGAAGWRVVDGAGQELPVAGRPARSTRTTGRAVTAALVGLQRPDGRLAWLEVNTAPLGEGPPFRVVATLADVTARVEAERALRGSESRFRLLAEHASDAIARYDLRGRVLYASPSAERVTGWRPDELRSMASDELVHPADRAVLAGLRAALQAGEDVPRLRLRIRRPDGSWTWVEGSFALVREQGAPVEMVTVVRDVSDQVAAEHALAASEGRYRLVAENASDMLMRLAPDGRILWVSPSGRRVTGYAPEDLVGRMPVELTHPDDHAALLLHSGRMPSAPGAVTRARFRHADGRWIWGEVTYNPLFDETGALVEVHTTLRDVTARVEEDAREQRRAREREELVAVVSHELRAPLGALGGLLWLAMTEAGGALPDAARTSLESALSRLSRLRRLASDLVVMTQLDADTLRLERTDVDLAALVEDLAGPVRAEAGRAGVELCVRALSTLVLADPDRVAQVVDNLIANAVKFSPSGGRVTVEVSGDLDWGRVVVTDEGPGVPPEERELVFARFHRAPGAQGVPGSGLGLAIARAITAAHRGRIRLEEGPGGRGTRAVLELPRE